MSYYAREMQKLMVFPVDDSTIDAMAVVTARHGYSYSYGLLERLRWSKAQTLGEDISYKYPRYW